ncbi:hypothetical protein [Sandarakinorhabdus sp.]|uniref:hypothetical protein n=1 Tax=Sandarakinorhabdus sp. TaxID=1916663 RepID=UPI00286DBCF6|nr:hypothetical protein [Sandarakinorhabdus sp.]
MIPSSLAPIRRTPPWRCGDDGAPLPGAVTFLVRPGTVIERATLEADLAGPPYNAPSVMRHERLDTALAAVHKLLDGEARDQAAEALQAVRAAYVAGEAKDTLDDDHQQLITALEPGLRLWPDYAALLQAEARRQTLLPVVAVQRFLVGWEGIDDAFERDRYGLVTDACMAKISSIDLTWLGWQVYQMLYAEQHRPFLQPPSPSGGNRPVSRAGARRRLAAKAGTSAGASGPKTPA